LFSQSTRPKLTQPAIVAGPSAQPKEPSFTEQVSFDLFQFKTKHLFYGLSALLLLVGGATYAVSSLTSTKSLVTQHALEELLIPPGIATQLMPILSADKELRLYRADTTRSSDTVESLFLRLGVDDQQAASFIRSNAQLRKNLLGKSSRPVRVEVDAQDKLLSLKVLWASSERTYTVLELTKQVGVQGAQNTDTGAINPINAINATAVTSATAATYLAPALVSSTGTENSNPTSSISSKSFTQHTRLKPASPYQLQQNTLPLHVSVRFASAKIKTSLFAATDSAQIPDSIAAQLADVFASEIDFHRSLQKGDRFSLLYEALDADGESMGYGKLLGVEFVSAGVVHQAMYFKESGAREGNYFNLKGQTLKRPYLAAPLKFSRITSGYKMRMHPIWQTWKAHKGIDYAAPTGSPVHTVGKGVVRSAGWMNGLGNVVFVDHSNSQTTVYAHLSQFKVKTGQTVEQGQVIGAVGETGWTTGPHLHFEFRVNDQYRDPSTIARQSTPIVLSSASRALFDKQAAAFLSQLSARGDATEEQVSFAQ
jgi:murein DD-endopeptidase MepM/ murein hydrolase activator NlpD